jgi:glycosyltransferase involved in cell wall biosynthesis
MDSLSIVIPAYNEEDGIEEIVERVLSIRDDLRAVGFDGPELIVVDDGSTDRTVQLVKRYKDVRLIRHSRNSGYGAALKTGFSAATGNWIGFLDADGTYPPEHFPELCAEAASQDADIVIGSRMAGADSEMPAVRKLGNVIFARLVSIVSAQNITDSASGMRVFKKSILDRVYPLPDGLNLTPVMSTRALHEQLRMVEVPIPYSERVGRSKLSVFGDGMLFAQSIVWTALSYNPVRTLGLASLVALSLSAALVVALAILRLSGVRTLGSFGAFLVFLGVVLAVSGLMVLTLGISFNYFVALFHKTPVRQGLFGRPILKRSPVPYFGMAGTAVLLVGVVLGLAALAFGISGMTMERLWFYYVVSAGLALVGIQLIVAWVQMQVLDALSIRDELVADDMQGKEYLPADMSVDELSLEAAGSAKV